jgi:hypothetical protein
MMPMKRKLGVAAFAAAFASIGLMGVEELSVWTPLIVTAFASAALVLTIAGEEE